MLFKWRFAFSFNDLHLNVKWFWWGNNAEMTEQWGTLKRKNSIKTVLSSLCIFLLFFFRDVKRSPYTPGNFPFLVQFCWDKVGRQFTSVHHTFLCSGHGTNNWLFFTIKYVCVCVSYQVRNQKGKWMAALSMILWCE